MTKKLMARNNCTNLQFYVGWIPRDLCERILRYNGEFLLRKGQSTKGENDLVLSLRHNHHFHHYIIVHKDSLYYIQGVAKKQLLDLIQEYIFSQKPVVADGATLKVPYVRPNYFYHDNQVEIFHKLGKGSFGKVYSGVININDTKTKCAVKILNPDAERCKVAQLQRIRFFEEAAIMLRLHHPNILSAYGILADKNPLRLVIEYASGGSLHEYLSGTKQKDISRKMMCQFCSDAAEGLQYLASKNVIHGDIAARNCLLDAENRLKISDFGLSSYGRRSVPITELMRTPTKWLAPEVFVEGFLTQQTDIWAYGILLWEIWTYCRSEPYPGLNTTECIKKVLLVSPPIEPPTDMPELYAKLMLKCLQKDPSERLSTSEIVALCDSATTHYLSTNNK